MREEKQALVSPSPRPHPPKVRAAVKLWNTQTWVPHSSLVSCVSLSHPLWGSVSFFVNRTNNAVERFKKIIGAKGLSHIKGSRLVPSLFPFLNWQ